MVDGRAVYSYCSVCWSVCCSLGYTVLHGLNIKVLTTLGDCSINLTPPTTPTQKVDMVLNCLSLCGCHVYVVLIKK